MKKILILEDNQYDIKLTLNQLKKDKLIFSYKATDDRNEFI